MYRNWETEHYNYVLEITVSFLGIHKWEPDIYIGFSPTLHLHCGVQKCLEKVDKMPLKCGFLVLEFLSSTDSRVSKLANKNSYYFLSHLLPKGENSKFNLLKSKGI
jgi:hypothetical protein